MKMFEQKTFMFITVPVIYIIISLLSPFFLLLSISVGEPEPATLSHLPPMVLIYLYVLFIHRPRALKYIIAAEQNGEDREHNILTPEKIFVKWMFPLLTLIFIGRFTLAFIYPSLIAG
ncbi:hypothetical protein [Candidatus Phycosocius spiralis]|uniref:Uncharacterized protein n=1 Tax=Candidatus Phycosocius spiralis TaxID=2815099 RepID=A0ABQ4PWT5_9PROT|nr:hypothetical protein [Candidatus Phycosocius spiralis]GIU67467.1 hypothetical protein PsB1_1621 [Candidatus Phycosocius spiralis]